LASLPLTHLPVVTLLLLNSIIFRELHSLHYQLIISEARRCCSMTLYCLSII
jgi:hypothetical protein